MEKSADGSVKKTRFTEILGILKKHNAVAGISAEKLPLILSDLGPVFVKLGQIMSMQSGILPPEYCKELAKLRSDVPPIARADVHAILEAEYGADLHEIFTEFEAVPLGAASIAQAHFAKLHGGERVVVKILRTGVYETMAKDIVFLKRAAGILKYTPIGNTIDLNMLMDEMWATAKQEMDFTIEAANAKEFYENNKDVAFVTCPRIFDSYSTSKVLVMEYIDGLPIDHVEDLTKNGYDLDEIGKKLAHNYVKQVIEDGFFHADPHSGNILIRDGKIVWIDLGMMGRLRARDRKLFYQAVLAIAGNDTSALKDFVLSIGVYKGTIDEMRLTSDLESMLTKFGSMDFEDMDLVEMLEDFLAILKRYNISIPKGISMLGRSMATIQGTLRSVSPQINFIEILADYVSGEFFKSLDLQNELKGVLKTTYFSFKKSLDIPAQLSDAIKMLSKGTAKVNLDLTMSDSMNSKVDRMLNKIILTIMNAAILVGSSLICTTDMKPQVLGIPTLGFVGYMLAVILGIWLIASMLRKK